jgi:hypothetical protein
VNAFNIDPRQIEMDAPVASEPIILGWDAGSGGESVYSVYDGRRFHQIDEDEYARLAVEASGAPWRSSAPNQWADA